MSPRLDSIDLLVDKDDENGDGGGVDDEISMMIGEEKVRYGNVSSGCGLVGWRVTEKNVVLYRVEEE